MTRVIPPGSTIGVLGSGQLGRMLAIAARRMGYRVHTLSPSEDTPTGQIADAEITADYEDLDAIRAFAKGVNVVTFEFENVSTEAADVAAEIVPVRPAGSALHITQQRAREKAFLALHGFPTTPCSAVHSVDELAVALGHIGTPAILKTAVFGYDGKGQHRISSIEDAERVWGLIGHQEAVVERVVDLRLEMSVVAARGIDGEFAHFGAIENTHRHHILDISASPARVEESLAEEAVQITHAIMEELSYIGVLCVEFFVGTDGRLLVNEIAPRPHNSAHFTFDACVTSQFEQQVRAICGLPLGATTQMKAAAMVNLLGDLWLDGEPDWAGALAIPDVKLHLYGKSHPRAGRKMGHITALADTVEIAIEKARAARDLLV
ncbi:MAG TPA: 5-(carboxyamino)imidazole ribonucleotide synthase [Vicinamibacterales bacterium]|nr:5-(carboxyamino)imidazole ribonucleotide synthase [Vicinamibacterales bacterium]